MNTLNTEQRRDLLDRLRKIATLQNSLWQEAKTISDELLDCELDAVLQQVSDLAVATAGPGEDLTYDDVDSFVAHCQRLATVQSIRIDLSQPEA
jgi:hypothetical protein